MKKLFTVSALLLTTLVASAQLKLNPDAREVYNKANQAFNKQDVGALVNCFTESGVHVTPTGIIVSGREALKSMYTMLFGMLAQRPKADKTSVEVLDENTRTISSDVIVTAYKERTTLTFGSRTEVQENAFTVLLVKKGNNWLIENLTMTPMVQMPQAAKN
ncbi:MAG: nuclear transport factor 2 family protein [Spirosomataceae bacterium]